MTIWWVENEEGLLDLLEEILKEQGLADNIRFVNHWDKCEQQVGDVVIHDMHGVGDPVFIEGVRYEPSSGDVDFSGPMRKPFDFDDVINFVKELQSG